MRNDRRATYDYEFRTAPVRGLFPNKSHDPLYLCDEAGRPFAWSDGTVIDLNTPPAGPLYLADEAGIVFAGLDAIVLTVE